MNLADRLRELFYERKYHTFSGRTGYSTRTAGDVSGLTGVTFGIGVSRGALGFDYALVPQGDLGMTHWIALVYKD